MMRHEHQEQPEAGDKLVPSPYLLLIFGTVWMGGAAASAGLGWVLWRDRRVLLLVGLWLFPVGFLVAREVTLLVGLRFLT